MILTIGDSMVATNSRLSRPWPGGWPCPRFDLAAQMLAADAAPTVEQASGILKG